MYIFSLTHMNAFIHTHANVIKHKCGDTFASYVVAHSLYALSSAYTFYTVSLHTLAEVAKAHAHAHIKITCT